MTTLDQLHPWIKSIAQNYDAKLWADFHRCKTRVQFTLDDYQIGLTGDMESDDSLMAYMEAVKQWEAAKERLVNWCG